MATTEPPPTGRPRKRLARVAGRRETLTDVRRKAVALREWRAHVAATPVGFKPVLLNKVPSYQIAVGKLRALREHFAKCAPMAFWPTWLREP